MNIKDFILGYLIGKGDGGGGSSVEVEPLTVTENGEYSEEGVAYSPVIVNVPTGGASNVTKLASFEVTSNTTSTTATLIGNHTVSGAYTSDAIIYVRVRDKAGNRNGYFYGSDSFFINNYVKDGMTPAFESGIRCYITYDNNYYNVGVASGSTGYGVYAKGITNDGTISIYERYNSAGSKTIDGTYVVDVFSITTPDGIAPFAFGES